MLHPRTCRRTGYALVPLVFALAAAGCSSGGSSTDDGASASTDALTSDEAAAGQSWDGEEMDSFTPDEEAQLSAEGDLSDTSGDDASNDDPGAVETATLHPQSGCTRASGFNHGSPMSICVTSIDGKPVEQSTAAGYVKMRAAAQAAGVGLAVVSGFRTMAQQRQLYAMYKNHTGNLAAPPGFSNHQSGHALDLNTSAPGVNAWLVAHASQFGFRRTVPSENWHYEKW